MAKRKRKHTKAPGKAPGHAKTHVRPTPALQRATDLSHELWEARRTMLAVAPLVPPTWQPRVLAAVRCCVQAVDLLTPDRDEG